VTCVHDRNGGAMQGALLLEDSTSNVKGSESWMRQLNRGSKGPELSPRDRIIMRSRKLLAI
jgi:hypothetical protein